MSPDIRRILRDAAPRPRHAVDVDALTDLAQRRQAQRRRKVASVGAMVAVLVVAGAVALVADDGGQPPPEVVTTPIAENVASRASISLPEGWRDLPRVETSAPTEVLVVGSADRPDTDPIPACDVAVPESEGAAYVSVYEYFTGDPLRRPDGTGAHDVTEFVSRPADFASRASSSWDECAPMVIPSELPSEPTTSIPPTSSEPTTTGATQPAVTSHAKEFPFLEAGRFFVARVVSTGDPTSARFDEAIGVLNGLQVALPDSVTTTTATPTDAPTTTVASDVVAEARQGITDALRGAFGAAGPGGADEGIAGGMPLGEAAKVEAREANEEFIGVIVPRVNWVTLQGETHATVNFDLFIDGRQITANTTGEAIVLDGKWRITAETFCTVARRGGVTCPDLR